jgi:[ribosomal protein S5]-alanine N-acetyltransferase
MLERMHNPSQLQTPRLTLIATTLEHIQAELEAPERLTILLDAYVSPTWPTGEYDRSAMEFFRDRFEEGGKEVEGWYGWYAIRPADMEFPRALVGVGGYIGPPNDEGIVEIGYSVLPEWQRKGYATEIVKALVEQAFHHDRIVKVIAHTKESVPASIGVLLKCGFQSVGAEPDETLRFERQRTLVT